MVKACWRYWHRGRHICYYFVSYYLYGPDFELRGATKKLPSDDFAAVAYHCPLGDQSNSYLRFEFLFTSGSLSNRHQHKSSNTRFYTVRSYTYEYSVAAPRAACICIDAHT